MPTPAAAKRKPSTKYPTWEYPAGSGIKIAKIPNRTCGEVFGFSYQVRIPGELLGKPNGRELLQRKTKEEAERLAEDRLTALRTHGTLFSQIPAQAQQQAIQAWGVLSQHNDAQPEALRLNFVDVVRAGIRALNPAGGRKTVADVAAELRASKAERCAAGGLDPTSEHDFSIRSGRIEADLGARLISDVTHIEIEAWLRQMSKSGSMFGRPLSRRSVLNYRNTFGEIFRHAKARQYCPENPFDRFTREDLKNLGGERAERSLDEINILTVDEARALLAAARVSGDAGQLGALVLRLFCGVRTAEVCQLDWQNVHWADEQPYIHIPTKIAKKRRIRHIDIPSNALEWLKVCGAPSTGPIIAGTGDKRKDLKNYCTRFNRIIKAAGLGREDEEGDWQSGWESNDTRHSFGSYHYALHGDSVKTAGQMGHKQGDSVLFAHYRVLVAKTDAERFFGITPSSA